MLSQIAAARVAVLGLAVLASTSLVATQASRDEAPPTLIDAAGPTEAAFGEPSWLLATTPIETDLNWLASLDRADDPFAEVASVALRSDVSVDLTGFRRIPVNETSFAWSAHVADVPGSYAIIAQRGEAVRGVIGVPGTGLFDLRGNGGGGHVVRQLDPNHQIDCQTCAGGACADGIDRMPLIGAGEPSKPGASTVPHTVRDRVASSSDARYASAGTQPQIGILVVYTEAARIETGGEDDILALIDAMMAYTNLSLSDSHVDASVFLAGAFEVDYEHTGSLAGALNDLVSFGDGELDEVHALRMQLGGDLMSILVSGGGGVAYCPTDNDPIFGVFAGSATGVPDWMPEHVFAHEVGHNLGCHHDHGNANSGCGLYSFSRGHRWTGESGEQWRSTMAYAPGIPVPVYSNPNILYDGVPTGVPHGESGEADNATTITDNAPFAAHYAEFLSAPLSPACPEFGRVRLVPDEYATIQAAVDAADHCDEIVVGPGVYAESINFGGKTLVLRSTHGPNETTIDATGLGQRALSLIWGENDDTLIEGLTLVGDYPAFGATTAVHGGAPQFKNCTFIGGDVNISGTYVIDASPTFTDCRFIDHATNNGSLRASSIARPATVLVEKCVFEDNTTAFTSGVNVYRADLHLLDCHFLQNRATSANNGRLIRNLDGQLAIENCTFDGNTAGANTGVLRTYGKDSVTQIMNSTFCRSRPANFDGPWIDLGGNTIYAVGDLNCDSTIDGSDLSTLLAEWGPCETLNDCPADFNVDGMVDGADLAHLLAIWGAPTR